MSRKTCLTKRRVWEVTIKSIIVNICKKKKKSSQSANHNSLKRNFYKLAFNFFFPFQKIDYPHTVKSGDNLNKECFLSSIKPLIVSCDILM